MSLATMVVDLLMKTDKFESGAHKAIGHNNLLHDSFGKLEHQLMHFAQAFAAAFAVHAIEESIDSMAKAATTAERLGIATEKFTGLQFAAKETEVDVEKLTKGMQIYNVTLGQAVQGNDKARGKFNELGLSFHELNNIPADEALGRIADKIKELPTAAEKAAAAADLFGKKVGPELLPLLELGSAGIEKLEGKAKDLGKTFNDEAGERVKQAHEAIVEMTASVQGLAQELTVALAPGIKEIVTDLTDLIQKFREAAGLKLESPKVQEFSKVLNSMSDDQVKGFAKDLSGAQNTKGWGGMSSRFAQGNLLNKTFGEGHTIDDVPEAQEALNNRLDKMLKKTGDHLEAQARTSREFGKPTGAIDSALKSGSHGLATLLTDIVGAELTKKAGHGKNATEKVTGVGGAAGLLGKMDSFMQKAMVAGAEFALGPHATPTKAKAEKVTKDKFVSELAHDREFHGNAALEKGSVAAFSQSRRSAAQNQLVELQRRALQTADKMATTLYKIEQNTSTVNGHDQADAIV